MLFEKSEEIVGDDRVRVVVDTNVFVSALYFGGTPRRIYNLIERGDLKPCFTQDTWIELTETLMHVKFATERARLSFSMDNLVALLQDKGTFIRAASFADRVIPHDPSDEMFLACAAVARAEYIISGDKHLLSPKEFEGIPILTPRQFLARVQ